MADAYEAQFTENPTHDPSFDQEVHSTVEDFINGNNWEDFPEVQEDEVTSYIKKLKIKKAPGRDGITNALAKRFTPNIILIITTILNI